MLTAAVAIRPKPSSRRADTPVLSTPAGTGTDERVPRLSGPVLTES
jgi:hypothetical protein